jgi:hypothetical protein
MLLAKHHLLSDLSTDRGWNEFHLGSLLGIVIIAVYVCVFQQSVAVQALGAVLTHSGISLDTEALWTRDRPRFVELGLRRLIHGTLLADRVVVFVGVGAYSVGWNIGL